MNPIKILRKIEDNEHKDKDIKDLAESIESLEELNLVLQLKMRVL